MIVIGDEARDKMLKGINLVADAVKPTLGPMAKTVVLKENGRPIIVNDGVTVAKAVHHEDEFVDMGAKLLIEVATQAQSLAGDGTTTACVLAQAFCERGMDLIKEGANPVDVSNDLKLQVDEISSKLLELAKPIEKSSDIVNVASIAANNDKDIGSLIAKAIETVGKSGVVTVSESQDMNTTVEVVNGLEIERGYRHHHFTTDKEKNQTVMENPLILVSNLQIVRFQEMVPLLEKVAETKRPLILISRLLEEHAMANLIMNVLNGIVKVCPIESPDYGHISDALLEDIAIVTGAKFVDYHANDKLEEVEIYEVPDPETGKKNLAKLCFLKRANKNKISNPEINFGDFTLNIETRNFTKSGKRIYLTEQELKLLISLAKNPGVPISREELAGIDEPGRAIDVGINRLRKKIEDDPTMPIWLQTVRGKGYILRPNSK